MLDLYSEACFFEMASIQGPDLEWVKGLNDSLCLQFEGAGVSVLPRKNRCG